MWSCYEPVTCIWAGVWYGAQCVCQEQLVAVPDRATPAVVADSQPVLQLTCNCRNTINACTADMAEVIDYGLVLNIGLLTHDILNPVHCDQAHEHVAVLIHLCGFSVLNVLVQDAHIQCD